MPLRWVSRPATHPCWSKIEKKWCPSRAVMMWTRPWGIVLSRRKEFDRTLSCLKMMDTTKSLWGMRLRQQEQGRQTCKQMFFSNIWLADWCEVQSFESLVLVRLCQEVESHRHVCALTSFNLQHSNTTRGLEVFKFSNKTILGIFSFCQAFCGEFFHFFFFCSFYI